MTSPWRHLWCMLLLAGLALPTGAATAEPNPGPHPAPKSAKRAAAPKVNPALKGYYAMMVRDLGLDAPQQAVLAEKVQARHARLEAFMQENGPRIEASRKALEEARKNHDKDAVARIRAELKALTDAQARLEDEGKAEILAVLTPAQREHWAGTLLYNTSVAARYKRAALTPEQVAKVKALCVEAAREIARHSPADQPGAAAIKELKEKLARSIEEKVLTPEQRARLTAPAPPAGAR